jgi:integrase-like protein
VSASGDRRNPVLGSAQRGRISADTSQRPSTAERKLRAINQRSSEEAVTDLLNDYSLNRKKTLDDVRRRIRKHLAPYFGDRRMVVITTADLRAYVARRQAAGIVIPQRKNGKNAVAPDTPKERRTVVAGRDQPRAYGAEADVQPRDPVGKTDAQSELPDAA